MVTPHLIKFWNWSFDRINIGLNAATSLKQPQLKIRKLLSSEGDVIMVGNKLNFPEFYF